MKRSELNRYIKRTMEDWLLDLDNHVSARHMNATDDEIRARIGKHSDNGRLMFKSSTFLDNANGDDIVEGLVADLQTKTAQIQKWLKTPAEEITFYFNGFPAGVSGKMCECTTRYMPRTNIDTRIYEATGYKVILRRGSFEPFCLVNAYPIS